MKKKNLIIVIIILILIASTIVIIKNNFRYDSEIINEFYNQYKQDVDSGVEAFMESKIFKEINEETQIETMNNLLKKYQRNGIIRGLYYDDDNKLFSFTYNSGDIKGALGGVLLKKWDPIMN